MHLEIRAVYRMKFYPGKWDAVNSRGLPDSTVNSPHEYILGWNYLSFFVVCLCLVSIIRNAEGHSPALPGEEKAVWLVDFTEECVGGAEQRQNPGEGGAGC